MTLEWVKWRRGPLTSQMPSSGSRQMLPTCSTSACQRAHSIPASGGTSMPSCAGTTIWLMCEATASSP